MVSDRDSQNLQPIDDRKSGPRGDARLTLSRQAVGNMFKRGKKSERHPGGSDKSPLTLHEFRLSLFYRDLTG